MVKIIETEQFEKEIERIKNIPNAFKTPYDRGVLFAFEKMIKDTKPYTFIEEKPIISSNESVKAEKIIELFAKTSNLTTKQIKSKTRKRDIVEARHLAIYAITFNTKLTLKKIGKLVGGRDHSTIIHAIGSGKRLIEIDGKINEIFFNNMSIIKSWKD